MWRSSLASLSVMVVVCHGSPATAQSSIEVRVSSRASDAEERVSNGSIKLGSSDLEMAYEGSQGQIVGVRFEQVEIPRGAAISAAYIQFTADEITTQSAVLSIHAQDVDDAPAFGSSRYDISDRQPTAASVEWQPPPWTEVKGAGADQRTPDLAAIVQEVVDRPGWQPGNGIAFIITNQAGNSGGRVAESFDGRPAEAPLLLVEFTDRTGTVRVPEDEPTIQDGIDAADDGATVMIAAGTYEERVTVDDKAVRIECVSPDTTVIDPESNSGEAVRFSSSASGSALINCTVRGASHSVRLYGDDISIIGNWVEGARTDAISIERRAAGSLIRGNTIIDAGDDCIDVDHPGDTVIQDNLCIEPSDDGIEIRNATDTSSAILVEIEGNQLLGAGEDGIQIIDYPGTSDRAFVIRRNLIRDSADAGIGFMSDGQSKEDFSAAALTEPVDIHNNTLSDNRYGITASGNTIMLNNIIAGSTTLGLKGAPEMVAYTLFHDNATDYQSSAVDPATTFVGDPEFDADFHLGATSAAIDAGTAHAVHEGAVVLDIPASEYRGSAPDLGAFER